MVYDVHSTSKNRIFEAARAIFDQDGLQGLSIRKIAEAVDLTPMAIYRHYADKDALLDALMLDGFAAWEAHARAISTRDPIKWLEQVCDAFRDFALREPRRYEAAFLLPANRARRYPDDFVAGRSPVINLIYERIDEAKAAGKLNDVPTAEMALALSALVQGLVSMYQAGRFVNEREFRAVYKGATRHLLQSYMRTRVGGKQR